MHSASPLLPFECPHLHTCPHQPKPLPFLLPQYWFSTFQQPLPTCAPCPDLWVPAGSDGGQGLYSVSSPPAGGAWGDPPWPSETKYQGRGNGLTGAHGHLKGYRLPAYPTGWGPRMLSSITNRGGVRGGLWRMEVGLILLAFLPEGWCPLSGWTFVTLPFLPGWCCCSLGQAGIMDPADMATAKVGWKCCRPHCA